MDGEQSAPPQRPPIANVALASSALAVLIAGFSVAAIIASDTYRQETLAWRVQIEIQDWFDLVLLVPLLLGSSILARRGRPVATLVLGGALLYAVYNLVIYAFAVRFNRLFLAYCAALGLSVFTLIGLLRDLSAERVRAWFPPHPHRRFAAVVLIALAVMFLGLWLLELVPASVRNAPSQPLVDVGLVTNPVHALDLSVTLPTLFLSGFLLWRDRPLGYVLAPMTLVFAILTDASIIAIILYSRANGVPAELGVAAGIFASAIVTLAALLILLKHVSKRAEPTGLPA